MYTVYIHSRKPMENSNRLANKINVKISRMFEQIKINFKVKHAGVFLQIHRYS